MSDKKIKFVFVTGGVVSSLGKGIVTSSLGLLLKLRGLKVTVLKMDPYLNVDPGTLSPYQHGEVFVTEDGAETDLDLGHYERFLDINMSKSNNTTTGQVYGTVIEKERQGIFLGKTVQVIPHITDEIKRRIHNAATKSRNIDVIIVEVGGTVGDIEGQPFLEAIRQFKLETGLGNTINIHLTLIPFIKATGETKTKPTQHSVQKLREIGIQPDIIYCRTERRLKKEAREKIALFCNVAPDAVIEGMDVDSIYEVPLYMEKEKLADKILNLLRLGIRPVELSEWRRFVKKIRHPDQTVNIAIAGKYVELQDAYKSIMEAFVHAGVENNAKVEIVWVATEDVENSSAKTYLKKVSGILIPGGFGDRGIEGKIEAVRYARENDLPFFGICMGLQCAVIEYARSVCGLVEANSREFSAKQKHSVIDFMPGQDSINRKGGTMRLGAYPCVIKKGTIAARSYRKKKTMERHRHRYEVSNEYRDLLKQHGMVFSGLSPDNTLAEIIELPDKKWFLAVQFHPEFKSRPLRAHPLFGSFVKAALEYQEEKKRITV